MSLNVVVLQGRLTRDPDVAYLKTGTPKISFSLANNTGYGDYKKTHFFECEKLGKGADKLADYISKGSEVLIKGELEQNRWEDKEGHKRSKVRIRVVELNFVGSKGNNQDRPVESKQPSPFSEALGGNFETDDDIPF